jgi:glycine/D-amino acid oxidase-like deaminating enzyme
MSYDYKFHYDVAIIGGGVAGLFSALYLRQFYKDIVVIERDKCGSGATNDAAGMLAPIHELDFQEVELFRLGQESLRLYELLAKALPPFGLDRTGTIEVALTADDVPYLRRQYEFQQSLGLAVEWLDHSALHALVPALAQTVPAGILCPTDIQVDNRQLVRTLVDYLRSVDVHIIEERIASPIIYTSWFGHYEIRTPVDLYFTDWIVIANGLGHPFILFDAPDHRKNWPWQKRFTSKDSQVIEKDVSKNFQEAKKTTIAHPDAYFNPYDENRRPPIIYSKYGEFDPVKDNYRQLKSINKKGTIEDYRFERHITPSKKVYPVRGQMVSVAPSDPPLFRHVIRIRSKVYGNGYLVPKADRIVIGSTSEEMGYDRRLNMGGVMDILNRAYLTVPGLYDRPILETWVGLRPATFDRHPVLEQVPNERIMLVNGLYRHGILLGPWAARQMTLQLREAAFDFNVRLRRQ